MRNTAVYPITYEEKQRVLDKCIQAKLDEWAAMDPGHRPMGDITVAALNDIKEDLARLEDLKS